MLLAYVVERSAAMLVVVSSGDRNHACMCLTFVERPMGLSVDEEMRCRVHGKKI